jgi:hydrogenase expression/formation protein HypE
MGAIPRALSLALVLEEGLDMSVLDRVIESIARTAAEAGVVIATGDTKVVERRGGDGMMITTAGIAEMRRDVRLGTDRIVPGDAIIVTGHIADHGLAVMSAREGLAFESELRSDVAPLGDLVRCLCETGSDLRFLRDPTRGGLAGVLAEIAEATRCSIEVEERMIPISRVGLHTAELLGLDPLTVANEGKIVVVVAAPDAEQVLKACRSHPLGQHAAIVGRVLEGEPPLVEMVTRAGGRRIVQRPYGEELPRIC